MLFILDSKTDDCGTKDTIVCKSSTTKTKARRTHTCTLTSTSMSSSVGITDNNGDPNGAFHKQKLPETASSSTIHQPSHQRRIPILCQYWCYITNYLVPNYVPFNIELYKINFTFTIVSALFLGMIRYLTEYGMVTLFGWPYNTYITKNASASVAAIFHSIQLVPSLYACFRSSSHTYNPSQHMKDIVVLQKDDIWWQDTVQALLQFCTGYMMYDAIVNIVWMKLQMIGTITTEDYLFLGHHIATILYMTSTRILQQGHQSAMICMLLGEMTNPFHNSYYVAIAAQTLSCCNGPLSQWLYHWIELLFAISYVFVRTVLGPFFFLHLTFNLWTTGRRKPNQIPMSLLVTWTILIWGVVLGSIPWIMECFGMIQKYFLDPTPLHVMNAIATSSRGPTVRDESLQFKTEL
jgi:hypothetical protein